MQPVRSSILVFIVCAASTAFGCAQQTDEDLVSADVQASVQTESISPSVLLTSPTNQWQWFDIPGTECGNATQTGVAVNKGTGTDLVIWMAGGGMCFDQNSCLFQIGTFSLVQNINNFGQTEFNAQAGWLNGHGILNRNDTANPYRNSTFVFIPYCTGDFHSGSTTQPWQNGFTMHYSGRLNLIQDIAQIAGSFPNPSRVTVFGESAGAFGATINFFRFKNAYPTKRVDLIADSGPFLHQIAPVQSGSPIWNLPAAWPPGCTTCASDFRTLYTYNATTYPTSRFAYPIYDHDAIVTGGSIMDPYSFGNALSAMQMTYINSKSNSRFFAPGGTNHVVTNDGMYASSNFMQIGTWLNQMVNDSPNWSNHASWGTTCKDSTVAVTGSIEQKYVSLGGCGSVLGRPTSATTVLPNNGTYASFINGTSNGAIYADANAGVHEIHGPIKDYWTARGSELGGFGFPTTDQLPAAPTAAAGGVKSHFTGGMITHSATTGTHGVSGAISGKYGALGADASWLGLPTSDEFPTGFWNFDRRQNFERGYIYWSAPSGAVAYSY